MNNYKELRELTVLLAEDEEKLAQFLTKAIGDNFRSFSAVSNAKDAIEFYKYNKPDLVITDIMMPEMNGLELAAKLREINEKVNIIVLSAFSDKDKLLGAIDAGVKKYFIKPFEPDELLEYIAKIASNIKKDRIVKLDDEFSYNYKYRKLSREQKVLSITKRELTFIELLLEYRGKVVNESIIKKTLWNEDVSDERLRTFIKRLRFKTSKSLIKNVLRQGYTIECF